MNKMEDMATCPYHLALGLMMFRFPRRTFIVVRCVAQNPNRPGVCSVAELLEALLKRGLGEDTWVSECLKALIRETLAPNKAAGNRRVSKDLNPDTEQLLSQSSQPEPSTVEHTVPPTLLSTRGWITPVVQDDGSLKVLEDAMARTAIDA